jgi:lysophospholipase
MAMGGIRGALRAEGVILSAPYLQNGVSISAGRLALARAVGLLMPWAQFASRMQETWITSDPQMLAESRADPLLLRTATPRWYVSMLAVQIEARRRAGEFNLPLLCLTGEADPVAVPAAVVQFYESAGSQEKKLIRYPGLLHELLREMQRETVFADILNWMQQVAKKGHGDQIVAGAADASDGGSGESL